MALCRLERGRGGVRGKIGERGMGKVRGTGGELGMRGERDRRWGRDREEERGKRGMALGKRRATSGISVATRMKWAGSTQGRTGRSVVRGTLGNRSLRRCLAFRLSWWRLQQAERHRRSSCRRPLPTTIRTLRTER